MNNNHCERARAHTHTNERWRASLTELIICSDNIPCRRRRRRGVLQPEECRGDDDEEELERMSSQRRRAAQQVN